MGLFFVLTISYLQVNLSIHNMTENYLHFIWKSKRMPFHRMRTTTGKSALILDVGIHNASESGPDFFNGRILLDGIEWCGNIEMHVKSSDWFKHGHQNDRAYDTVVLHVVFEHDAAVYVDGKELPTIEIKEFIDTDHYRKWEVFAQSVSQLNCKYALRELDRVYLESMMSRSLIDRLNRKTFVLDRDLTKREPAEVLYFLLAGAFGAKVNRVPFEELTHRLPLAVLRRFRVAHQRALIYSVSGLIIAEGRALEQTRKLMKINPMEQHVWKRKGLRPQGKPEVRLQQFADLVTQLNFEVSIAYLSALEMYEYLWAIVDGCNAVRDTPFQLSKSFFELLLVNCMVPFLWWLGNKQNDSGIQQRAIDLLLLVAPEQNFILKKWSECGIKAKNGYESQALIELYNEHCTKNKCLNCEVGVKIVNA